MKQRILEITTSILLAAVAVLVLIAFLSSFVPPSEAYIPAAEVIIKGFNL